MYDRNFKPNCFADNTKAAGVHIQDICYTRNNKITGWHTIMYIVHPNGEIDDQDLEQLQELLEVLDHQFTLNADSRKRTHPTDQNIFWQRLSYIVGLGFVMCQQYINLTYPIPIYRNNGVELFDRDSAFKLPPIHSSGYSIVQLINVGANYWKHYQGFVDGSIVGLRRGTIKQLEALGIDPECGFICEGLLDRIVETEINPFIKLLGFLTEWRSNLIKRANMTVESTR